MRFKSRTHRYLMAGADPEIQMNPDHMNELFFLIQCVGVRRFHTEFKEHGGEWRVFRFIHKSQLREDSASWPRVAKLLRPLTLLASACGQ